MLQNNSNILNDSLSNVQDVFNNSTNLISKLNSILKTINYNQKNLKKLALGRLKKTGDLICNTDKYKDSIEQFVTDASQNVLEIQKNILNINKKMSNFEVTSVLTETLQQVKQIESQLKSIHKSILTPLEVMKKVVPKIHENMAKETYKENQIITENTIVTYLKLEYIVNNVGNSELSNGWKVLCENKIYSIMSAINWKDICTKFADKYKNYETKKDVYYYFYDGDKLVENNSFVLKQEKIEPTNLILTNLNNLTMSVGTVLNEFLLLYESKLKKFQNLKNYSYPMVPVPTGEHSMFLTRGFKKTSSYDPLLGAGIVPGAGGFINYDDFEITFNGTGDFIVSTLTGQGRKRARTKKNNTK